MKARTRRSIVRVVQPPIDLIALDLDGTLLDERDGISPGNRRAIRNALDAGVRVVLVTGRGADAAARVVRELELDLPAICAHGALTKDFLSGRTLGHIPIPLALALTDGALRRKSSLGRRRLSRGTFLAAQEGTTLHMEDMRGPHWREVRSLSDAVTFAPTFVRFLGRRAAERMRAAFAHLPLHFKHEVWGDFEECAVTSPEATKESALARLCGDFEIPAARVLAIGDSRNDVPMMRWAGIGVAMGNAPAAVRDAVGRVTETCDRDGVARAIERYVR